MAGFRFYPSNCLSVARAVRKWRLACSAGNFSSELSRFFFLWSAVSPLALSLLLLLQSAPVASHVRGRDRRLATRRPTHRAGSRCFRRVRGHSLKVLRSGSSSLGLAESLVSRCSGAVYPEDARSSFMWLLRARPRRPPPLRPGPRGSAAMRSALAPLLLLPSAVLAQEEEDEVARERPVLWSGEVCETCEFLYCFPLYFPLWFQLYT